MTELPSLDGADDPEAIADAVAERRDEVLAELRDHAGQLAYRLAKLDGGDYGRRAFSTDGGEWTVKYEGGDLQFLLFDARGGDETYVISEHGPPDVEALAGALGDYDAFVAAFNDYVRSLYGILDGVDTDFPEIASSEDIVDERDRILGRIEECCDRMAGELRRYEGTDYGSFSARVGSTRWELKWDEDGASYLRAGGENGVYVLSQYGPPSAADLRAYAPDFHEFVEAYNDHVADLELDLEQVEL